MNITTRFTIASEEGIKIFLFMKMVQFSEMYKGCVEEDVLNQYQEKQFNRRQAINELNNLTTQMITVFVKDVPVGYVLVKQAVPPELFKDQKTAHLSSFYILPEYDGDEVREALWAKCLSVTHTSDVLWIEMLQTDPLIPYMRSCGFVICESWKMDPFGKASYLLVKQK